MPPVYVQKPRSKYQFSGRPAATTLLCMNNFTFTGQSGWNQVSIANTDWFSQPDRECFPRLADFAAQCREYFYPDRS
jgi:hypothetical protein